MYNYKYGGKSGTTHQAELSDDMLVVRTKDNLKPQNAIKSEQANILLNQLNPIAEFPEAGVSVFKCRAARNKLSEQRDIVRKQFKGEKEVRFAGRALRDAVTKTPIVYTENFFIKFVDDLDDKACEEIIKSNDLTIKKKLGYATNAYFVEAKEGTGLQIFDISQSLLDQDEVEYCHPELIRPKKKRTIASNQWHLKKTTINGTLVDAHINVESAWSSTLGEGIVIAVIDDGFDIDHEEFSGENKIISPWDVTEGTNDPRPKDYDPEFPDDHGTACAGVACANGEIGASGVAPKAKLMPIRNVSGLGSQAEADAFEWAVDQKADVISCSWGPRDGWWKDPYDIWHFHVELLSDSARLAVDYAINHGREGKGCIITWAAGNGNENVENDGYASYDKVIAVAACNDTGRRSAYSDYGDSIWCAFPSGDSGYEPFGHPDPLTSGIWTTDRKGKTGYNPGLLDPTVTPPGDDHGNYTDSFGGTSSACPGVAGLSALILAVNPDLKWHEVREIIKLGSVKIDEVNGNYNGNGHSPYYGYGRPDAGRVVEIAKDWNKK